MEKLDSGGTAGVCSSIFIDTSLDTHLAMLVSDSETVSDLKKKIVHEHPLCFPSFGDIKISSLKVKRRGHFYHLSDSMLVKRAFDGVSKSWFLFVDATSDEKDSEIQQLRQIDSGKQVTCSTSGVGGLLRDGPKRSSLIGDLSLPHVESEERMKQKYPSQKFNAGDSDKKVAKDSENESKGNDNNNPDISLPGTNAGSDEDITVDHNKVSTAAANNGSNLELIKKTNYLATDSKVTDGDSMNEIRDVQGNIGLHEAPGSEFTEKGERKTKRKTRSSDSHALDKNHGLIHASAVPSVAKDPENTNVDIVSVDLAGDKNISLEPLESAALDVTKLSGTEGDNANFHEKIDEAVGEAIQPEKDMNIEENAKSLEDASPPEPPAKKKRKREKKKTGKEDASTSYADLTFDSNKETSKLEALPSQFPLGDKQKDVTVNPNQITTDSLETRQGLAASPRTDKRKSKRKSSKDLTSSSARDLVGETGGALVVGVHEKGLAGESDAMVTLEFSTKENLGDPITEAVEKEIEMGDTNVDDAGSRYNAPSASGNLHAADVASTPDLVVQEFKMSEDIEDSRDQNGVLNDKKGAQTRQLARVEGEGEFSKKNDHEAVANGDKGENIADGGKSVKSSKSKRKSRKTKDTIEGMPVAFSLKQVEGSGIGNSSTEPVKAEDGGEPDAVIRNVLESLQQSNENQENSEKAGKKSRKKTKKKRSSNVVDGEDSNAVHQVKGIDYSSKTPKKAKFAKPSATEQLNETSSEFKNNAGIESDPLHIKQNPEVVGSLQDLSHKHNGNNKGEAFQDVATGNVFKDEHSDDLSNQIKLSHEKEKMNVDDNFGSNQVEHNTVANSAMQDVTDIREGGPKLKRNKKMQDLHPNGSVNSSWSLMGPNEKQGGRGKARAASSSTSQQPSKVKNDAIDKSSEAGKLSELNASVTHSLSKKKREAHVAASNSSFVTPRKNIQPDNGADYYRSHVDQSRTSMKGVSTNNSRGVVKSFHASAVKPSGNNKPKVVKTSDSGKNLSPMSGSIFKDDSNWNSEDDGEDTSDASTRTPSEVSSDQSDEDSDATFKSRQNGTYAPHGKENGGRNTVNLLPSGQEDVSLEKILRSSSRYKKAKLTASQSQPDDYENDRLPFDCVPGSQAN